MNLDLEDSNCGYHKSNCQESFAQIDNYGV